MKNLSRMQGNFLAFHTEPPNVNLWDYFIAGEKRQRRNCIIERYVMSKWVYIAMCNASRVCIVALRNCPVLRNSITQLLDATFSISEHVNKRFKLRSVYNFSLPVDPTFWHVTTFAGKVNLNNRKSQRYKIEF